MQQEMSRDIDKSFNEALQIGMHKLTAIISFLEYENTFYVLLYGNWAM